MFAMSIKGIKTKNKFTEMPKISKAKLLRLRILFHHHFKVNYL